MLKFKLLIYHNRDLTLDRIVEIREQGAHEEAEEPEPERQEKTTTVWKLTEMIGLVEGGVKVFEDTDWKEHRAGDEEKRGRLPARRRF